MECLGLGGARNLAAMTVSFFPLRRSTGITVSRKQASFRRFRLYRHFVRVRAAARTGSESCVAVDFDAEEEDYVKAGGSEVLFVQMQQNKPMEMQSKLSDKVVYTFVFVSARSENGKLCCIGGFFYR